MNSLVVCFLVTLAVANASVLRSSFLDYPTKRTDIVGPSGTITHEENYPGVPVLPAPVAPIVEPIFPAPVLPEIRSAVIEHTLPAVRTFIEPEYLPTIRSGFYDHGYAAYGAYGRSFPWAGLSRNLLY